MSGSGLRFFASTVSSSTASDGSPRRDFAGLPDDADDVAEMDVDVADPARVAHELDAPRAVDEVEEDELAHLAPRHDAAGEAPRLVELAAGFERLGRGANGARSRPGRESASGGCHGRPRAYPAAASRATRP